MIALDAIRLLPAIEALYGAAVGTTTWSDALARVGDAVRADHLILHAQALTPFLVTARIDERDLVRSLAVVPEIRDAPPLEGVADGGVVVRSALVPDRSYERTAHYNELIRPLGGYHGMLGKAGAPAQGSTLILCRAQRRSDFGGGEAQVVGVLLPHLAMAIDVGTNVKRAGETTRSFEALLESIGEAVLICDRSQKPLLANAAARQLLAEDDGLGVGLGGLFGATTEDTRRLRVACAMADERGSARLRLSRRSGRSSLMLRIVAAGNLTPGSARPGQLAIFVTEPDAARPVDREAIAEAFSLTRREAEIAALLAGGSSPVAIAATLGLGLPSVRVYLTRIFDKTGTHSQAALVALLRGFV